MLIHQFDGFEWPGREWRPCPRSQSEGVAEGWFCIEAAYRARRQRVSASLIWADLGSREDRTVLAMFSFDGGVILHPEMARINCAYARDGGIDNGMGVDVRLLKCAAPFGRASSGRSTVPYSQC